MAEAGTDEVQSKLYVPVQRRFAAGFGILAFTITFALSLLVVEDLLTVALRALMAFMLFAILGYLAGLLVMFSSDPRILTEQEFLTQLEDQQAQVDREAEIEDERIHDDQQLTFIGGVMPGAAQPVEE
jgi:hypothetical protein